MNRLKEHEALSLFCPFLPHEWIVKPLVDIVLPYFVVVMLNVISLFEMVTLNFFPLGSVAHTVHPHMYDFPENQQEGSFHQEFDKGSRWTCPLREEDH